MENQENSKNKVFMYMLGMFLLVFVGTGIFLAVNKQTTSNEKAVSTSNVVEKKAVAPTFVTTKGFINLQNVQAQNNVDTPVNLSLNVDSNGENVTALDVVMSYDPIAFDFISAESIDPSFKVYSYKKDNRLTLTVVKNNQNAVSSIFKSQSIVNLSFQPKSKGDFKFTVLPSFDLETTKFVNEKTEVIYPGVNEIIVKVN